MKPSGGMSVFVVLKKDVSIGKVDGLHDLNKHVIRQK